MSAVAAALQARIEALEAVLRRVDYWLDTDEEYLATLSDGERVSHERMHRQVREVLAAATDEH